MVEAVLVGGVVKENSHLLLFGRFNPCEKAEDILSTFSTLRIELTHDPEMPHFGIHSQDLKIFKRMHAQHYSLLDLAQ